MGEARLEKVTAFATRGVGVGADLLVFRHARSGVQVPAGTVEPGETPEAAAWRELAEETGLTAVRLVRWLGRMDEGLGLEQRGILRGERLRVAPAADAAMTGGTTYRGSVVPCSDETDGWVRVALQEFEDLEEEPLVLVREEWGWVPADSVCGWRVRNFYHFEVTAPTADRWRQQTGDGDEGRAVFELYWEPLVPRPRLIGPQAEWLEMWHGELVRGTRGSSVASRGGPGSGPGQG